MTRALIALALASMAAIPGTAAAAPREQNFTARLSGANEVPVRETLAQGHATFRLNRDGTIDYRLVASDIDNVSGAHIHCPADENNNAGVSVPLSTAHPGQSDGVNSSGTFSSTTPCPDGTMTVLQAMRDGLAYVNVHTNDPSVPGDNTGPGDFSSGEIRGQIEPRSPSS